MVRLYHNRLTSENERSLYNTAETAIKTAPFDVRLSPEAVPPSSHVRTLRSSFRRGGRRAHGLVPEASNSDERGSRIEGIK